jgi:hypothetical protein
MELNLKEVTISSCFAIFHPFRFTQICISQFVSATVNIKANVSSGLCYMLGLLYVKLKFGTVQTEISSLFCRTSIPWRFLSPAVVVSKHLSNVKQDCSACIYFIQYLFMYFHLKFWDRSRLKIFMENTGTSAEKSLQFIMRIHESRTLRYEIRTRGQQ